MPQEHRCARCRALLAKSTKGSLDLRRNDWRVKVSGDFSAEVLCYRCGEAKTISSDDCPPSSRVG